MARPRCRAKRPGLVTEDVSAWFGEHKVLHRVNLEMQANQVTSLIGPSGCGKSTFLRILNRMHELVPSASLVGNGSHRRHRHLPVGPPHHRHPAPDRHGVPEAESVPGDVGRRERRGRGSSSVARLSRSVAQETVKRASSAPGCGTR